MAWITAGIGDRFRAHFSVLCCLILKLAYLSSVSGIKCGYPGSPAYGRPSSIRENYDPGENVGFTCALGYTLRGNLQRLCLHNGTWSGHIPICDRSLPGMDQHASSRATLALYAAEKAIDGNKDTCTYTDKRKPRWIRVDLRKDHVVQAVALTVPKNQYKTDNAHFTIYVISVKDSTTASYHKCADFNGRFSTPTVKLSCPGRGIHGSYVHIEDNRSTIDYFSACEIEIFVRKATYECGEVERPPNSYTMSPDVGIVEYKCMFGYRLLGEPRRQCLPSGQWSGTQPLCEEIVCPNLTDIKHGIIHYIGPGRDRPVQNTMANITCEIGYQSDGTVLRCLETGEWSEGNLECRPVNCGVPKVEHPLEKYKLLNGSTTYGSLALFYCGDQDQEDIESSDVRVCREDGTWSGFDSGCVAKNMISTLGLVEEQENAVPNGIIIGMAVVVFLLLVVLILILLFKRKQLMRRQSTDSLPSKETSSSFGNAPPSPDESKQGTPYENDAFYASISMEDEKPPATDRKQQVVERGILSTILFAKRKQGTPEQRAKSNAVALASAGGGGTSNGDTTGDEPSLDKASGDDSTLQPVYAQIDYQEKRRSRLAKSLTEQLDCSEKPKRPDYEESIQDSVSCDSELDSEPIKLRELPPIPDDDHSSGTYASLSQPPEPPPPIASSIMRDNNIYNVGSDTIRGHHSEVMKDNDLYSAS